MCMTSRKNATLKALQSHLAKAKKNDPQALLEWLVSCNTNAQRGKTYDQHELLVLYDRDGDAEGASKACHLTAHNGERFKYIVIKRHKVWGYIPNASGEHSKCTGNQLLDEVNCWQEYAERPEADFRGD